MVNTLRIKRRAATGLAGAPASLAAAEIAYNEKDDTLYYGRGDNGGQAVTVLPIAGPGQFATIAYVNSVVPTGTGTIIMQDTAPTVANVGDLWLETDTQDIYVYINDGTSLQWVVTNPMSKGADGATGVQGPQGIQGPPGPWTQITQAAYDALSPPNPSTLYVIIG